MRPLLLLCLLALCGSADAEVLTLKDGRHLTGVYDPQTEILDMGMAKIRVAASDIDSRAPSATVEPSKATPARDASLLGDPKTLTPEERARKLAILHNLLDRCQAQVDPAKAVLETRKADLQAAQMDPDLHAIDQGRAERAAAANEGAVRCRATYPKADLNLISEWSARFEAQVLSSQKTKQSAAERKIANATAAVKTAAAALDKLAAEAASLAASIDKLEQANKD